MAISRSLATTIFSRSAVTFSMYLSTTSSKISSEPPPHVVEDCNGVLKVFSDGSVWRCPVQDLDLGGVKYVDYSSVVFKDVTYDQKHNLSLRLYRPTTASAAKKLPVVIYFHGGGFVMASRVWPHNHHTCQRLASEIHALVVAPDFRLAPEHKLPAAVDDAMSAMEWLQKEAALMQANNKTSGDCGAWMGNGIIDFDRVFVMGDSSGGTMVHHLAVLLGGAAGRLGFSWYIIRGYVLMAPFFTGVEWTKSEEGLCEQLLNLELIERFWRLALPQGETRDHPMANPFGTNSPSLEKLDLPPILVVVGGNEMLKDRLHSYVRRLKELGKNIEYAMFDGQEHGFWINDPYSEAAGKAIQVVKNFVIHNSN